jgi:hypothetical protein
MTKIEDLLGVTTCPTCQKRFRVPKKYESFIGKEIQCPKCKRPFVIQIESPAPIEQAAMSGAATADTNGQATSSEGADQKSSPQRRRRTRAEIRKAAYKRIRTAFKPFLKQLEAIQECDSSSEEKIRMWCTDVLRKALGYTDDDLAFELQAFGDRIDIAIKHDDKVILIIECKKRSSLPESARKQAVRYAICKSADWAAVTNGHHWELHRVIPISGKDPEVVEVFNISLLDDDGLSNYDVERMFLLTKKALLSGETEKEFHLARCLDDDRLLSAMFTERSIKAIRRSLIESYKKKFKTPVKLTDKDVAERLEELTRPSDLDA